MIFDVFADVAEQNAAFFADCALAAAHDVGVFDVLRPDGWIATDGLATLLGTRTQRLGPVLGALAFAGVIEGEVDGDRMRWRAKKTVARPDVVAEGLGKLGQVLLDNQPLEADPNSQVDGGSGYLGYLADKARAAGDVLLTLPPFDTSGAGKLLDAGGGHGEHCAAWLRQNPENTATLVDRAAHLPAAAVAEFTDRCTEIPGDVETVSLARDHDISLLSNVLHLHSDAGAIAIAHACARATKPGGKVVIKEVLLHDLHTGPAAGAHFSLSLVAYTKAGRCYAVNELRRVLEVSLGVPPTAVHVLVEPGGLRDQVVVWAAKPA